jgi:opacity protein-like surface antigen
MFCQPVQSVEIVPYVGYMFSSNLNTLDGEVKIDNGVNYGIIFDARFDEDVIVEEEPFDTIKSAFDVNIEYFQGGAQFEMEKGIFRPFAAFTLGATLFNPANEDINSEWRFSFTFAGGIKYYFIKNIGVRLQWRFLLPVYFGGGALFCGERGCGASISGNTLLLQYDLTAGLVVVI